MSHLAPNSNPENIAWCSYHRVRPPPPPRRINIHLASRSPSPCQFHFTRTQIVQHWDRVVAHDVLPAPLNLVYIAICLPLKLCVSKLRYPSVQARIGCLLFWLVMGPLGAVLAIAMWLVSLPWVIWMLLFGAQTGKEVDRKSERLKYVVSAPGLVLIALLLGFLSIFVGVSLWTRRKGAWQSYYRPMPVIPFCLFFTRPFWQPSTRTRQRNLLRVAVTCARRLSVHSSEKLARRGKVFVKKK